MKIDEFFGGALREFRAQLRKAIQVSENAIGVEHTGRQNRSLFIFAKLIAHIISIDTLISKYEQSGLLLDHASISTLGRTALDACLMTMYISDPKLTADQWNLRRNVLYLHDLSNRSRFLKSANRLQGGEHTKQSERIRRKLCQEIAQYSLALGLSAEKQEKLSKGQAVYVDGSRGAVREAGWDLVQYDFCQAYWSPFVHSHPVSFLRADEHGISFDRPSEFQIGNVATTLTLLSEYTESTTHRMAAFTGSLERDHLGHIG